MSSSGKSSDSSSANQKLWGGRFSESTSALVEKFSESVSFDSRLYRQDIRGSQAHARMLAKVGVLTSADAEAIVAGLDAILAEIEAGSFVWSEALEDVHMNIEARLTDRIGDAGKRLHTGRSRNDQVATDMRLYVRDVIDALVPLIDRVAGGLLDLAEREADTVMPGFTHLQIAQPVTFGHHMLAWREQMLRDRSRLLDCRKRMNLLPLGAAALAGTVYPIDRHYVAEQLGFDGVTENSLDTVSDRDYAIEFCAAASLILIHLSRWSEELILWASPMFGFVDLPDRFCTGSSIMPQKKNPDVPELVRGKTGRVIGNLNALLVLMKGQPLAYNRDNQEDKPPLFDTVDTVSLCLQVYAEMIPAIKVRHDNCRAAAAKGFSTATDLADYLVMKGLPFRDAHHVVGSAVAHATRQGCDLAELPLGELQAFSALIGEDVYAHITLDASVAARRSYGGTAPEQVRAAIARARAKN
ncbi:argininosuccinate lyase [Sinimarinibacterium sp. CAU 1509]|uniref:argininosuccinate lyase n=1 Tax=Sinimarinibacterium sp. CAU 1509 TaxID=2562283 RepID=UPI0010ACFDDB|nr:argininosuccinate lyase [Sinimarinibacterium sp. CAU 1509]TJY64688.1 argininosuccinate lyase [Sinimarinibacterium sp. CAU 1509]